MNWVSIPVVFGCVGNMTGGLESDELAGHAEVGLLIDSVQCLSPQSGGPPNRGAPLRKLRVDKQVHKRQVQV